MSVQLMCPYVDVSYSAELDTLLHQLTGHAFADKLQQLVFHLQTNPKIPELEDDPAVFFSSLDINLEQYVGVQETEQREDQDRYQELVDTTFDPLNKGPATITCKNCADGEVEWSIKQTRSADEGSTVYCLCLSCSARWKM